MTTIPMTTPFQSILDSAHGGARTNYVKEQVALCAPDTGDAAILRRYLASAGIKSEGSLEAAVTAFQKDYNASLGDGGLELKVDGKAGPKTLEALRQRLQTIENRGTTESSKDLQAFLKYQPGKPNLNAAKPEGAVSSAKVLSQSGDAAKRAALEKQLVENKEQKAAAKAVEPTKVAVSSPKLVELEAAIDANKTMIRALQGSPSPAATKLRQERIGGLRAEQSALRGGAEYKAVRALADDKTKLASLENDRMLLPTGKDIETRTTELKGLRARVADQEKAVEPFKAKVEAEDKRIEAELFALQHRNATPATQRYFDAEIARRTQDIRRDESALRALPEHQAREEYRGAKRKLEELRSDSMFMPSGAEIEQRMKGIEEAQAIVNRYQAAAR